MNSVVSRLLPVALAVCVFAGVTLSLLPHFISLARFHDSYWGADYDEVGCYSPVISDAAE